MLILRRTIQLAFLFLFVVLLFFSGRIRIANIPADFFLRTDPLAGFLLPLISHAWIWLFWPALLILISAVVFGRFFCGWICPMGTTLAIGGHMVRLPFRKRNRPVSPWPKYFLLAFLIGAAFCGINLIFWGSPIALVTRLYGLLLAPLIQDASNALLEILEPALRLFDSGSILFWLDEPHFFHTMVFIAIFWCIILTLEIFGHRFWCHSLCPAGALLGLASKLAFFRRKVSAKCAFCGACVKKCPAGIIDATTFTAPKSECLLCGACKKACKFNATNFGFTSEKNDNLIGLGSRRKFLAAGMGSLILGCAAAFSMPRQSQAVVRPPGSVPEDDFLKLCLRCGECMHACPTGALQPLWLENGISGMFSPRLDPYSGGCQPDCVVCGNVCPSQAILPLVFAQKRWAKVGTAVINQQTCLAWGEDRRCMVCKENCPWNAVDVVNKKDYAVPVPVVHPNHCYGCGFCQKACPQSPAAIVVEPIDSIRLNSPDFKAVALKAGVKLKLATEAVSVPETPVLQTPPGFLE